MIRQADAAERQAARDNPLVMDDEAWRQQAADIQRRHNAWTDANFKKLVDTSTQWQNLELLLRVLRACGARPLIVGLPMDGKMYRWMGVSSAGRTPSYDKLSALAEQYGAALV